MPPISRLSLASAALLTLLAAPLPAMAKVVGEPVLTAACAKEAAQRLAMNESDVLTLPTELSKGTYTVYAQVSLEDGSLTMVECKFDQKKRFTTISINGESYKVSSSGGGSAPAAAGGAPQAATAACLKQMGGPATVQQVSQLRAGYHEIIMTENSTGRRVACTVSDSGNLEDWVEMN